MTIPAAVFGEAGRSVGSLLTRTFGARSAALGQSLTADSGDIEDVFFNPAGLARLEHPVVSASFQNGLLDDNIGVVNYGHNTGFGAWYIGASGLDAGNIELNQSDGIRGEVRAQQDIAGTLGLAIGRYSAVSAGAAVKYLRSELAEAATASSLAGDVGLNWQTPLTGFALGAAYQNFGQDLKYEVEDEPLPTQARVGASYLIDLQESARVPEFFKLRYQLLIDGVKPADDDASVNAGLEVRHRIDSSYLPGWASFRGGYISATETVAVGAGFTIWNFVLDYGLNIVNDLDNTHRFTFGYQFAPKPGIR
jgi:hypothetical protein